MISNIIFLYFKAFHDISLKKNILSKKEEIEEDIIVDFDDKWSSLCFIDMEEQFEIDQRPTTEECF